MNYSIDACDVYTYVRIERLISSISSTYWRLMRKPAPGRVGPVGDYETDCNVTGIWPRGGFIN